MGELEGGDLGGEVDADFATFLKNREADLFGGRGCGGEEVEGRGWDRREPWGRASMRGGIL